MFCAPIVSFPFHILLFILYQMADVITWNYGQKEALYPDGGLLASKFQG